MQAELFTVEQVPDAFDGQEEWRTVVGFIRYEVSNMGRFRRKATGRILKGCRSETGYWNIGMIRDGKLHTKLAHRVVALAFLERPSEKHTHVNHKNKDRHDFRASNLEWMTPSENQTHALAAP